MQMQLKIYKVVVWYEKKQIYVLGKGSLQSGLWQMSLMTIAKQIGSRVRELRRARKMTQAQLAESSARTVDGISQIERGVNLPTVETLLAIGSALGVSLSELVDVNDNRVDQSQRGALVSEAISLLNVMNELELAMSVELLRVVKHQRPR